MSLALMFSWVHVANANEISVVDSLGEHTLPSVPTRPAVLDWNLFEQVVELGVTPIAGTDMDSYQDWVVKPGIPESTEFVGTRSEPNLEKIAALQPDVILITKSQQDLMPRLQQIAPVLLYTNFRAEDDSAQVAIEQFQQLSHVFAKESVAKQKLADLEHRFDELKSQLHEKFGPTLPKTLVMRFANTTSTFIYTDKSMVDYVVKRLGLTSAMPLPASKWGIVQKPISDLKNVDGYVLYILPFNEEQKLQKSVLWRAMPFVRLHKVNSVASVWSYGGAMSLQYTAEAITKALLEVAPKS